MMKTSEAAMESIKLKHMHELFLYKQELRKKPQLRRLFLELTLRCNENCLHCGSCMSVCPAGAVERR